MSGLVYSNRVKHYYDSKCRVDGSTKPTKCTLCDAEGVNKRPHKPTLLGWEVGAHSKVATRECEFQLTHHIQMLFVVQLPYKVMVHKK